MKQVHNKRVWKKKFDFQRKRPVLVANYNATRTKTTRVYWGVEVQQSGPK